MRIEDERCRERLAQGNRTRTRKVHPAASVDVDVELPALALWRASALVGLLVVQGVIAAVLGAAAAGALTGA